MNILIALTLLALDLAMVVDLGGSGKDPGEKLAWAALILLLPVLGTASYFLLGRSWNPVSRVALPVSAARFRFRRMSL